MRVFTVNLLHDIDDKNTLFLSSILVQSRKQDLLLLGIVDNNKNRTVSFQMDDNELLYD